MTHPSRGNERAPVSRRIIRVTAWVGRRRYSLLSSALRGAAHAAGAGGVGLVFWWIQHTA
ncbi:MULTISPECIES: hypothetical protein [Streptomycetaceae]|uniref:hypothetical protein n=1 Tax=unclassified Streptomyces TaxID=2593676 RepID=UPI003379D91B